VTHSWPFQKPAPLLIRFVSLGFRNVHSVLTVINAVAVEFFITNSRSEITIGLKRCRFNLPNVIQKPSVQLQSPKFIMA